MAQDFFSFIIPCFNGSQFLQRCLNSIFQQQTLANYSFEVIVVDNNSTDDSLAMAQAYTGGKIRVLQERAQGRSQARNCGVRASQGNIICFVDVDVELYPDWFLQMLAETGRVPDWALITSAIQKGQSSDSWFERFRIRTHDTINSLEALNRFVPYVNTAAIMVKRVELERINLFDPTFDYFEDLDLGRRIGLNGGKLIASRATIKCFYGMSAWSYIKRSFFVGKMVVLFEYKWSEQTMFTSFCRAIYYYFCCMRFIVGESKRLDYCLFQLTNTLACVLGVIYSTLVSKRIAKYQFGKNEWIVILAPERIMRVNIKTSAVKIFSERAKSAPLSGGQCASTT